MSSTIMLPATPGRSKMNASLQNLSSASAFEDVKNVCARFTSKFDTWVAQARSTKKRHANEFQRAFQEHLETQKELKTRIAECAQKAHELNAAFEINKLNDLNGSVATLSQEQETKQQEEEELIRRVNELKTLLNKRRQALEQFKMDKKTQLRKNRPELECYEDKLAMRIESFHLDEIKFIFTHIDEKKWDREFSFALDVQGKIYKLNHCDPMIPNVEELLTWLNTSRDFYTFLKLMRRGFLEFTKSQE